jgi:hypothetical protein
MFEWRDGLFTLLLLISGGSWIVGLGLPRGDEDQELVASHDLRVGGDADVTETGFNASTVEDVSRALDAFCHDLPHARC